MSKQSYIEFGEWLTQLEVKAFYISPEDKISVGIDPSTQTYVTNDDGTWQTMEELYDRFWRTTRTKPR
jgi:hypothetical protein